MSFELFSNVLIYLKAEIDTLLAGKSDAAHTHTHASTTEQTADQHHAQAHTLASHSTRAHAELTGIGADDHHPQAHTLTSHSTRAHAELTGIGANDHHPQAHTHAVPILGNLENTIAASTTRYLAITAEGAMNSSEPNARAYFSMAGTLKNWRVRTTTPQSGTGSLVLTVYKNGIADALVITIGAGAAAGAFGDLAHSVTFAAGDEVSLEFKNNATATSAKIGGWGFEFDIT